MPDCELCGESTYLEAKIDLPICLACYRRGGPDVLRIVFKQTPQDGKPGTR
jgi:hypothetical protein